MYQATPLSHQKIKLKKMKNSNIKSPDNQAKIRISISSIKLEKKPIKTDSDFKKQMARLNSSYQALDISPDEMIEKTLNGYSISPFCWKNNIKDSKNFESIGMLVIDVDNDAKDEHGNKIQSPNTIDHTQFLEILRNKGLECSYILSSMSSTPSWPKYRVFWLLEEPITDKELAEFYCKGLVALFHGIADPSAKDLARQYFAHKEILFSNPSVKLGTSSSLSLTLSSLITFALTTIKSKVNKTKFHEIIEKTTISGINYNIYYNIDQKSTKKIKVKDKKLFHDILCENSKLFQRFKNLEKLVNYDLLAISTNLRHFHGELKFMKAIMEKYNFMYTTRQYDEFDFHILRCVDIYDYKPMNLQESHNEHFKSYISIHSKGLRKLKNPNFISLDEGEQKLKKVVNDFLKDPAGTIRIVKAEVGIGKTKELLSLEGALLAFPTHNLIGEVSKRFSESDIPFNLTKALPESIPREHREVIESLQGLGAYKQANKYIKDQIAMNSGEAFADDLNEYFEINNTALNSSTTCLTTHSRSIHCSCVHPMVVFDEDIKNEIYKCNSIDVKEALELESLIRAENDKDPILFKLSETIANARKNNGITYELNFDEDSISWLANLILSNKSRFKGKILDFIYSKYLSINELGKIDLINLNVSNFFLEKKYLILSATVEPKFYEILKPLGFNIIFEEIPRIEHDSKFYQDKKYSFSKECLKGIKKTNDGRYKNLIDKLDTNGSTVITYQKFKEEFKNHDKIIHFNNCAGYDHLRGKDLIVLGLNNLPIQVIQLTACCLDPSLVGKPIENRQKNALVKNRVGEFHYYTFSNPVEQMVHLHSIEESIIQAVGRARHIREEVKIIILNDYPLFIEAEDFKLFA